MQLAFRTQLGLTALPLQLSAGSTIRCSKQRRCVVSFAQANLVASPAQLDDWISSQGIDSSKRSVTVGPSGLQSTKPVAKGEVCLSIPDKLWLTHETVIKSDIGALVADLEPWLAIALFLLHERFTPNSQWQAYIQALPTECSSPVAWSEEELKYLEGTQLLASVQGYRAYFQQRYEELSASIFSANPTVFPPETIAYQNFVWAVCTVRARVHAPLDGKNIALVPMADTVQHRRTGANAERKVKAAGLFGGTRALAIEAEIAIPNGQGIATDFGPTRTDGQLLLDYGVLDSSSAVSPSFALTVTLPEDDRFYDDKFDILETNGLQTSIEFALSKDGRAPPEMLAVMRLVNLTGQDSFLLESIFRNEIWEHVQAPISEGNEQAVCQSMIDGCTAALQNYPTSIEEDIAQLRTLAPGSNEYAAVKIRMGEKEALDAALQLFEERVGQLPEVEYYAERRLKRLGLLDKEGKNTWDGFFDEGIA